MLQVMLEACSGRSGSAQGAHPRLQVKVAAGQIGGRNWERGEKNLMSDYGGEYLRRETNVQP